jgi:hypothetical protein
MNTLQVKAAAGLSVPMEDKPRSYITDAEVATIADSTYYQRRLADGDLVLQDEPLEAAPDDQGAAPAPAPKKRQ